MDIDMRIYIVLLALVLSGCAVSQKRLNNMTDDSLCGHYGEMRTNMFASGASVESYKQEIVRRKLLTDEEWQLVDNKQIQKGMSVCGLKASWGFSSDREYSGGYGTAMQHAFTCSICKYPSTFVYSEHGKVTGWSK